MLNKIASKYLEKRAWGLDQWRQNYNESKNRQYVKPDYTINTNGKQGFHKDLSTLWGWIKNIGKGINAGYQNMNVAVSRAIGNMNEAYDNYWVKPSQEFIDNTNAHIKQYGKDMADYYSGRAPKFDYQIPTNAATPINSTNNKQPNNTGVNVQPSPVPPAPAANPSTTPNTTTVGVPNNPPPQPVVPPNAATSNEIPGTTVMPGLGIAGAIPTDPDPTHDLNSEARADRWYQEFMDNWDKSVKAYENLDPDYFKNDPDHAKYYAGINSQQEWDAWIAGRDQRLQQEEAEKEKQRIEEENQRKISEYSDWRGQQFDHYNREYEEAMKAGDYKKAEQVTGQWLGLKNSFDDDFDVTKIPEYMKQGFQVPQQNQNQNLVNPELAMPKGPIDPALDLPTNSPTNLDAAGTQPEESKVPKGIGLKTN
jgi:hypothetical protein